MNFLKISIGVLKGARTFLFALLLMTSLAFNATFLFWEVGSAAVKSLISGVSIVYSLGEQVASLRKTNALLKADVDDVSLKKTRLARRLATSEKKYSTAAARLVAANRDLAVAEKARDTALGQVVALHDRRTEQKAFFLRKHKKMKTRLVRVAGANVAGVVAEIVPFAGAFVVVALSTLELAEHCKLAGELNEIARILDFKGSDEEETEVCGMKISNFGLSEKRIEKIKKKWGENFPED